MEIQRLTRLYTVTREGRLALHHSRRILEQMWEGMRATEGEAGA